MTQAVTIAFIQQKGGAGKTTSCLNVAGHLAARNRKVLVVDLDPQASATSGSGIAPESLDSNICDVLVHGAGLHSILLETPGGYHLAPSGTDMVGAEMQMVNRPEQKFQIVKDALEPLSNYYDYILIDPPPGLGLLTINAIVASDRFFVPFDPGILSLESYKGLEMLMKEVSEFAQTEKLPSGAIVTQYRSPLLSWFKKKPSEPLIRSLDAKFKRLFVVPYSREISKAQVAGIPIGLFAPKTKTSMVYNQVAQYIEEICYGNK